MRISPALALCLPAFSFGRKFSWARKSLMIISGLYLSVISSVLHAHIVAQRGGECVGIGETEPGQSHSRGDDLLIRLFQSGPTRRADVIALTK